MSSRILPEFELLVPESIEEAVSMLSEYGEKVSVMAGGTDLLVLMKSYFKPEYVLTLSQVPGLDYVLYDQNEGLRIGAKAPIAQVVSTPEVKANYPCLWKSASVNGTPQTRNRATVVGNILRASPAGDCCCAALGWGGQIVMESVNGRRSVDLDDFFLAYRQTARKPSELAIELRLPPSVNGVRSAYMRLTRSDQDLAKINASVRLDMSGKACTQARVAMGCVAPTPVRLKRCEGLLRGQEITEDLLGRVEETVRMEVNPIDDVRSTAWYRSEVAGVLVRRLIEEVCQTQ